MSLPLDPLTLLERADKWYLGGGKAAIFAPAFPKYLDTPGFWDEAYFADIRMERLFCLLLLDENGRPLHLRRATRRWNPASLKQIYTIEGMSTLRVQEERVVTPNDTLASKWTLTNTGTTSARLHILLWSLQTQRELPLDETAATIAKVRRDPDALSFAQPIHYGGPGETPADVYGWGTKEKADGRRPEAGGEEFAMVEGEGTEAEGENLEEREEEHRVFVALGGSRMPDSWTVHLAETTDTAPLWPLSVFPEKFRGGQLAQEMQDEAGWNPNGLLHLALHYRIETPPNRAETLTFGASLALSRHEALAHLRSDMITDVTAVSRDHWQRYFAQVPQFACSDPYLERSYWYRWYGLRLQTVRIGTGQLPHPCVFEGIGAFRSHIAYSAQCHLRETGWMQDKSVAMGSLENFLARQSYDPDGFLPGHLYLWRQERGFYHAGWGGAVLQFYHLTGDRDFLRRVYPGLTRYADYFDRDRDREQSGLYDVLDQGETGQEYMSRYLFVDESADQWRKIQVKGVDATVYLYQLQRALTFFARELNRLADAAQWEARAAATGKAILEKMWDEQEQIFKDVHPQTGEKSPYKAAVGFYPFLTDIPGTLHLNALRAHLRDPATFGTPFPFPASSVDDPYFDAEAGWKGKRTNCPWNGRVWPMTTSHVLDAVAHAGRTLSADLRELAAEKMLQFVRMLCHEGDPKRPNCYEHYNPYTGTPSLYRGVDDYQHSWLVDLIIRHVAGVQPEPGSNGALIIDPLPFELEHFRLEQIPVRGHQIDISWRMTEGFVVRVDGQEKVRLRTPQRVEIPLSYLLT